MMQLSKNDQNYYQFLNLLCNVLRVAMTEFLMSLRKGCASREVEEKLTRASSEVEEIESIY